MNCQKMEMDSLIDREKLVIFPYGHELKNIEDEINDALLKLMKEIKKEKTNG